MRKKTLSSVCFILALAIVFGLNTFARAQGINLPIVGFVSPLIASFIIVPLLIGPLAAVNQFVLAWRKAHGRENFLKLCQERRCVMAKQFLRSAVLLMSFVLTAALTNAQPQNLLQNPNADLETQHWRAMGEATIESITGNNRCFVVRNGGHFYQDVILPNDAVRQYAVLIGRGSSERIHEGGAITGRPYLYGYMMADVTPNGGHILDYLQGQKMLSSARYIDEWVDMWGIFQVPDGTKKIRFFLNQALRRGVPHNGSAARFDNLGLYLFTTKEDAQAFVAGYH